jgi:serine/threonine protein kinase
MTVERKKLIEQLVQAARERGLGALAEADPETRTEVEKLLAEAPTLALITSTAGQTAVGFDQAKVQDQLGPYRLESVLGQGGMGKVFRATDTRMNRSVAIKLCEPSFMTYFNRELKAISALNHPHICTLYDAGPNYLVMELIEGETLAAKIRRGPLSLEEVLRFGAEIADALADAHSAGIIHRDLKPGNVMVTRRGVKVLDFGLAKEARPGNEWTQSHALAGTPAYMAPEQISQKGVDPRTDLFALGLILFEMATGRLPFPGASLGNILANNDSTAIPNVSQIRDGTFSKLDSLVARLLSTKPTERIQSASLVRDALLSMAAPPVVGERMKRVVVVAAFLGAIVVGASVWWIQNANKPLQWEISSLVEFQPSPNVKSDPGFSPDCLSMAYSWPGNAGDKPGIYVASVAGGEPKQLTATDGRDVGLAWSPDGTQIAFQRVHQGKPNQLMLVNLQDRSQRTLREVSLATNSSTTKPTWTRDGKALLLALRDPETQVEGLFRISLDGGAPQRLLKASNTSISEPAISPDGTMLAYVDNYVVYVQRLARDGSLAGDRIAVSGEGRCCITSLHWNPDNRQLLFLSGDRRRILAWDVTARSISTAYVAPYGLQAMTACWAGAATPQVAFAVSGGEMEIRTLELLDRGRKPGPTQVLFNGALSGAYSPDGRWFAFARGGDLWLSDAEGKETRPLTTALGGLREPNWSPDGRHIAFHSRREGGIPQIYVVDLDPAAVMARPADAIPDNPLRRVVETSYELVSPQWSRDGEYVLASRPSPGRLVRLSASGGEVVDLFEAGAARLDREGRNVYYQKMRQRGLFMRSMDGDPRYNPEQRIVNDAFSGSGFDVTESGLIYIGLDAAGNPEAIRFYDFDLKRTFELAPAPPLGVSRITLAVSPDGRHLLYDSPEQASGNLMLMRFRAP